MWGLKSQSSTVTSKPPMAKPIIPVTDRAATMVAMILSVMAENSMPHTLAQVLVDLPRACSGEPKALAEVHLSSSSAA